MLLKEDAHGKWLEFIQLQRLPVKHAVSLACSPFDPNLYHSRFDLEASYVSAKQVHGNDVRYVSHPESGLVGDALVTDCPHLTLGVRHADCQAALLYDPIAHRLAVVHSGWKGSVLNVYGRTVEKMAALGSKPENLLVCIGPSLSPESAQFLNYKTELPESFWRYQIKPFYFDFWAISRSQLEEAGVLPSHIEFAEEDTLTNPERFHSNRYNGTKLRMTTAGTLDVKLPS